MRTTIRMNEGLARRAKAYAAKHDSTFTRVVEEALIRLLAATPASVRRRKVKLPTFRGEGVQPGVDLNDMSEVLNRIDAGLPLEKRR